MLLQQLPALIVLFTIAGIGFIVYFMTIIIKALKIYIDKNS